MCGGLHVHTCAHSRGHHVTAKHGWVSPVCAPPPPIRGVMEYRRRRDLPPVRQGQCGRNMEENTHWLQLPHPGPSLFVLLDAIVVQ